ncbi:hypothetical protein GCM10020254_46380 [Streptomyces goshikiensis]
MPFDAYLDDEGRLRKVRHRFSYQNNGVIDVSSTTLLYGFGTPVTVALPPERGHLRREDRRVVGAMGLDRCHRVMARYPEMVHPCHARSDPRSLR